jgi:hypothetical protein
MLHGCGEKKVMAMDLIERRAAHRFPSHPSFRPC